MAKKLIWIDDRIDDMMNVARGMFHPLWMKGIFSRTIFFGDACQAVLAESVGGYQYLVATEFLKLRERKYTLDQAVVDHLDAIYNHFFTNDDRGKTLSVLAERLPLEKANVHAVVEAWKALGDATKQEPPPEHFDVTPIFDAICHKEDKDTDFAIDKKDTAFALDVVLLDGDERKLNCEESSAVPTISMELYRYITTVLRAECILYSRYTYLNRLQQNWRSLYATKYSDSSDPPVIHCRRGLYVGHIQPEIRDELIEICGEEEDKQVEAANQNS